MKTTGHTKTCGRDALRILHMMATNVVTGQRHHLILLKLLQAQLLLPDYDYNMKITEGHLTAMYVLKVYVIVAS